MTTLEKIKSQRKGSFISISYKTDVAGSAANKNVILEKKVKTVVRAGIDYSNLKEVREGIENGERGEVESLPWGNWSEFPFLIEHKSKNYIRLYPSKNKNHKPKTSYFVNCKEVDKLSFASFLTPSKKAELFDNSKEKICFNLKVENLI